MAILQPSSEVKDIPCEIPPERFEENKPHYLETQEEISAAEMSSPERHKPNIERFIGENLINKIGIVILVAGISIGVKYAIDHDLISPLMRIVLGYIAGTVLIFLAWRLKKNYLNYSAVFLQSFCGSIVHGGSLIHRRPLKSWAGSFPWLYQGFF